MDSNFNMTVDIATHIGTCFSVLIKQFVYEGNQGFIQIKT